MRPSLFVGILLQFLFVIDVNGQQTSRAEQQRLRGEERIGRISGQVVSEDGQRLARVEVTAVRIGKSNSVPRFVDGTDESGNFEFTELPIGVYSLSVRAPGYVRRQLSESRYYRTGEVVTLTVVRGGVITGTVKTPSGEALTHVPVQAIRVAVPEEDRFAANRRMRRTDDRGVYRLYGLEPGTYIISAGGVVNPVEFNKYAEHSATFYPSSTRGGATEVKIESGDELGGIDITYKGQQGYAVRGTVSNKTPLDKNSTVSVALLDAATGAIHSTMHYSPRPFMGGDDGLSNTFVFPGVADGEYYVTARSFSRTPGENGVAQSKQISVNGRDVLGLNLSLLPMGSISGRIVLAPQRGTLAKACDEARTPSLREVVVSLQRWPTPATRMWETSTSSGVPDDHGGYTIYDLTSGFYAISAFLPGSKWFVRSVVLKRGVSTPANSPEANDVTIDRIEVRSGVKITGLDFIVEVGAATVSGRVTSLQGSVLPSQMNAYLVSARPSGNSNFRLYQTRVEDNREFEFSNVAPGKYWLLLRPFPDGAATNGALTVSRLDAPARALLRKQAEAAKTLLDLKECQRVSGYSVRYVAQEIDSTKK